MMMKSLFSMAVAALLFTSCKKNASGPATVEFQLQATNTVVGLQRSNAASIQWTAGTATPTSVKFEAKKGLTEIEYTSLSSQQVNLFNAVQSTFGNIVLPDGTYNEIELKIQLNGSTSNPALQLNGTYNNGSANVPVSFLVTSALLVKTESNNVSVSGGAFKAVTALNLNNLMIGISNAAMSNATQSNGSIVISSTSNTNLYNIIISNIIKFHHTDFNHR